MLTRQVEGGTGEGNQNELTLHFGLGKHKGTVDIKIAWARGLKQKLLKIEPNQLIRVIFEKKNCPHAANSSM